jgi:zinc transport system ATP-binding protein
MANPVITVQDVTKTAGDRQLLVAVSFTIKHGSLVSLIGPNGAGKSTLVKVILGLDPEYAGTVDVAQNERIQYIPQITTDDQFQLPLSVHEYLSIGSTRLYSELKQAPDFAGALAHVNVDPTVLRQPFSSLSGGERQRVAIARALLADPTILVLDEPLAAVDYSSRKGLYELIRHLQQDHHMTVLLVSHDIDSVLPISDQILCLNQTLHTDCHPTKFDPTASPLHGVHHHC